MNMLLSDKQEHQTIMGDNSPVHEEQHHSSFDDDVPSPNSRGSTKPINMFNASPDKEANKNCIRVVKSRDQQLSLPSLGTMAQNNLTSLPQEQQLMSAKRQTFVIAESQDSSKIEWNVLNSHQDMSDALSQNNINIQLTAMNNMGSVIERQNLL